ncbi:hypothetical protein [Microvirga splendida]|uniref:Uncharacterized protein n=1 Tax=Microvirga splendida TaxID=2795727 RepID=A0ABS0Y1X2_9HYPH|nr:hypothetical protein [Microvirga splendida]MBJ6126306.1 hypothetical protein [Microvirga splendida]
MSSKRNSLVLPPSLPAAARKLFEPFPTVAGDDEHSYRQRLADMLATLQPKNSIEAFWAKDIVDLTLEIERLRQVEAGLLEAQARDADRTNDTIQRQMAEGFAGIKLYSWARERGLDHRSNTPEIRAQFAKIVEEYLATDSQGPVSQARPAGPSDIAQSFIQHSSELDRIGRTIAILEARRRSVLQELEHYRAARRVRARKAGRNRASFIEPVGSY